MKIEFEEAQLSKGWIYQQAKIETGGYEMKVSKSSLLNIFLGNKGVNLNADGKVLKFRYKYNEQTECINWICNGDLITANTHEMVQDLFSKYKVIEVTWKREY